MTANNTADKFYKGFPKFEVDGEPESIEVMVKLFDYEEPLTGYYDYDERCWYIHFGGITVGHRKIDDSEDIEYWYHADTVNKTEGENKK